MIKREHLDLDIVRHCTNRCAQCAHANPFAPPHEQDPAQIAKDLAVLKPIIHFDQLQVLGGEPLLHPRICDILDIAKASEVGDKVSVLTNGKLLHKMPVEFWQKLQRLQVSWYEDLGNDNISLCHQMQERYGFDLEVNRHALFYKFHSDQPKAIYASCPWKNLCYGIYEGYFYLCAQSAWFPERIMGLPKTTDGLCLDGLTEEKLCAFFNKELVTCSVCSAYIEQVPWHQCDTEEEWLKELGAPL